MYTRTYESNELAANALFNENDADTRESLPKNPRVKPTVSLNRETEGYRYINPRR